MISQAGKAGPHGELFYWKGGVPMRHYPREWLDDLYQRADIVDVVSRYVPLKKNGSRYWGLCPFHHEKSPSFSVSPDVNLYYCFGCKAGGNVIQFIMEMERLTYQEAVEYLADQMHMPVPEMREDPDEERRRSQRERLLGANRAAAQWYHEQLWTSAGRETLEYFYSRGLNDGIIRRFGLGASLDRRDALLVTLREQGYTVEELILAGLAVQKEEQPPRDFFRQRAMFPIIDQFGNVLAFGGRSLDGSQPKYLNTGDTPVFNKRRNVYAANLLKKERQLKRVMLVEGYMDVVALTQAGISGVAATLGTSLTPEQAKLLSRFAPEIYVAYDGDEPGQNAIEKALRVFEEAEVPVKALYIPDGLDPDEMIRQRGLEAFNSLSPMTPVRFRLMRLEKNSDFDTDDGRVEYVKSACELLRSVRDPVENEVYIRIISRKSGFDREIIVAQLGRPAERIKVLPARPKRSTDVRRKQTTADQSEQMLIGIMASGPLPEGLILKDDFRDAELQALAEQLLAGVSPAQIVTGMTDDQRQTAAALFSSGSYESDADRLKAATDCLRKLRSERLRARMDDLKQRINDADEDERRSLLQQMIELQTAMNKLKVPN